MNVFQCEKQGANTYMVYEISKEEEVDSLSLGMLLNNKIRGLAPVIYGQMDEVQCLRYNISSKTSLSQYLTGILSRERILKIFRLVTETILEAEEYMIEPSSILLKPEHVFVDSQTGETALICLPLMDMKGTDVSAFFKNIMFGSNAIFDSRENCDYVARIINHLNGAETFSLVNFRGLLMELEKEPQGAVGGPGGVGVQGVPGTSGARNVSGGQSVSGARSVPGGQMAPKANTAPGMMGTQGASGRNGAQGAAVGNIASGAGGMRGVNSVPGVGNVSVGQNVVNVQGASGVQSPVRVNSASGAQSPVGINGAPGMQSVPRTNGLPGVQNVAGLKSIPRAQSGGNMQKVPLVQGVSRGQGTVGGGMQPVGFDIPGAAAVGSGAGSAGVEEKKKWSLFGGKSDKEEKHKKAKDEKKASKKEQGEKKSGGIFGSLFGGKKSNEEGQRNSGIGASYGSSPYDPDETSIVMDEEVTTLLDNEPRLIRERNQEIIFLQKDVFRIGRKREVVDYCIEGNPTIGRCHAVIVRKGDTFYIVDADSKNHTYVNGIMIESNVEVPLENQAVIRLSDEGFVFEMRRGDARV